MADNWQARADTTRSSDRGGQRLGMAGKVEDEVDGVQDAVIQVDVRTVLQNVELGVGDLRVINLQRSRSAGPRTPHRRSCRGARQQVA